MSRTQPVSEGDSPETHLPEPVSPFKNPSYPQRTHSHERAHWQSVLKTCEDRIAPVLQKLNVLPADSPRRTAFERLCAQMQGARDQVADTARRLPGETGDLYDEDKHRLDEAVAALDRVFKQWDAQTP